MQDLALSAPTEFVAIAKKHLANRGPSTHVPELVPLIRLQLRPISGGIALVGNNRVLQPLFLVFKLSWQLKVDVAQEARYCCTRCDPLAALIAYTVPPSAAVLDGKSSATNNERERVTCAIECSGGVWPMGWAEAKIVFGVVGVVKFNSFDVRTVCDTRMYHYGIGLLLTAGQHEAEEKSSANGSDQVDHNTPRTSYDLGFSNRQASLKNS
ncbi:MAG: hypothetical protein KBA31_20140 [Alphaproteobacteria bacterium]|nr:hypothetical protein [Alphaproteobacteria bacterium]